MRHFTNPEPLETVVHRVLPDDAPRGVEDLATGRETGGVDAARSVVCGVAPPGGWLTTVDGNVGWVGRDEVAAQ